MTSKLLLRTALLTALIISGHAHAAAGDAKISSTATNTSGIGSETLLYGDVFTGKNASASITPSWTPTEQKTGLSPAPFALGVWSMTLPDASATWTAEFVGTSDGSVDGSKVYVTWKDTAAPEGNPTSVTAHVNVEASADAEGNPMMHPVYLHLVKKQNVVIPAGRRTFIAKVTSYTK